jgi:hypothetical protein
MKGWWLGLGLLGLTSTDGGAMMPAFAQARVVTLGPGGCPQGREALVRQLLQDLPAYANRANTQLGIPHRYVVIASQPEFQPLPLGAGQRAFEVESPKATEDPHQVFFTTLERTYQSGKLFQLQHYHWLFLTDTQSGWRLALLYSIIGPYPHKGPPLPPRDSSEGSLAQGIRTWLRDFRSQCSE